MKKHVLWSICFLEPDHNELIRLVEFDEGTSFSDVCNSLLALESVGVFDPSIHVEVYYTEVNE